MKKPKTLASIAVMPILILALVQNAEAQTPTEMQTFFYHEYGGLSIELKATREAVPGENITINLWINVTAYGVNMTYLTLEVFGFIYGQEKTEPPLLSEQVIKGKPLNFNQIYEYNYTVRIRDDVWDATHADLLFKYAIKDAPLLEYNPVFPITIVRNVYLEELQNRLGNLNHTYCLLNETFLKCFRMNLTEENLVFLNQTLWGVSEKLHFLRRKAGRA